LKLTNVAQLAQELLSTFSTSLGEIALIPSIGGVFTIELVHVPSQSEEEAGSNKLDAKMQSSRLWDRKTEGGFPGMFDQPICVTTVVHELWMLPLFDCPRPPNATNPSLLRGFHLLLLYRLRHLNVKGFVISLY